MLVVPPPGDAYPGVIEEGITALLERGFESGARALEPIAYTPRAVPKRPGLTRQVQGRVYRRDRFSCRYCGAELIPASIMELLGGLYPDLFPFHPNWKGGQTHPAFLSRSPVVDHIEPGASGGDWHALENLVTACWPCNARKGDFTLERLRWSVLPIGDGWDGLTRYYHPLWLRAGEPKAAYHRAWMKALGVAAG